MMMMICRDNCDARRTLRPIGTKW